MISTTMDQHQMNTEDLAKNLHDIQENFDGWKNSTKGESRKWFKC